MRKSWGLHEMMRKSGNQPWVSNAQSVGDVPANFITQIARSIARLVQQYSAVNGRYMYIEGTRRVFRLGLQSAFCLKNSLLSVGSSHGHKKVTFFVSYTRVNVHEIMQFSSGCSAPSHWQCKSVLVCLRGYWQNTIYFRLWWIYGCWLYP